MEYESLVPISIDIVFCMTGGRLFCILARFIFVVVIVPKSGSHANAPVITGGALVGKVVIRVAFVLFCRHNHHDISI